MDSAAGAGLEQADLSAVRIGAHDEIFQNGQPVLVGCDVESTYCYLLSLEEHRDADTWGCGCWNWAITAGIPRRRYQRDDLLAFAEELDHSLRALAEEHRVSVEVLREVLARLTPRTSPQWQAEAVLRRRLGERFHAIRTAVAALADHTIRASSVVENINSRLRNDFFLRRHLSGEYLDLVRFYLNHHRFPRSDRPDRVGRSPHELLTGQPQLHWLDQLTNSPSHAA